MARELDKPYDDPCTEWRYRKSIAAIEEKLGQGRHENGDQEAQSAHDAGRKASASEDAVSRPATGPYEASAGAGRIQPAGRLGQK